MQMLRKAALPRRLCSVLTTISIQWSQGIKGTLALGIDFVYDTLLVPALDEVSGVYGLIAEGISYR